MSDEEMEPDAATTQLLKSARSGRATIADQPRTETTISLTAELVGRESEFAELVAAFEAAKRGESRHVHLTGAAGFGKTRLLEGFSARLRSARARVVTLRATTAERSLPYAFAAQLVTALVPLRGASAVSPETARTLVALAPASSSYLTAEPDRATGDDALRRRSLAVAELVSTIAHDAPLVMLVDDVHWMDQQSRTLLASLATRLGSSSVLLVTAARSADRFVEETPQARRLLLAPLSVDDVGEMVMSIGQLPSDDWADALISGLHSASGGSPLLVLEALQLVMEKNQLALANGEWSTGDAAALSDTLSAGRAMQQRLSSLPAGARDALLRLSIAGTAVDDTMMTHILSQDGRESLVTLETRGLVVHSDELWRTAHDEIAALSIEMAGQSDRMRAHAAIAEYLERDRTGTTAMLLQAAQHRARMTDTTALDRVFVRAVRSAHLSGEHAAILQLGHEILGANASTAEVNTLVKRLPWRVRNRPRRWTSMAVLAASIGILAVSIAIQAPKTPPKAAITFTMLGTVDSTQRLLMLELDAVDLRSNGPIEVRQVRSQIPIGFFGTYNIAAQLANGNWLAQGTNQNANDGTDILRVTGNATVTTLIGGEKDQAGIAVAPDNKTIAYTSGQWHDRERAEIAVYDAKSSSSLQLTFTDAREFSLAWSPDGSRIAFLRSHATEHPTDVCWVTGNGSHEQCISMDTNTVTGNLLAWTTDYSVLLHTWHKSNGTRALVELDFRTGALRNIDSGGSTYRSEPSGHVVLCQCQLSGYPGEVYAVFSPTDPTRKRVLQFNGRPLRAADATVLYVNAVSAPLESISVPTNNGTAVASVGQYKVYDVTGIDAFGKERSVPNFQWSSSDTLTAVVDSAGKAHFISQGTVRLTVTAGGWRTHSFQVTVVLASYQQVLFENWQRPMDSLWTSWGYPDPSLESSRGRRVLRVNGDGHLQSGVVSRLAIDDAQGVGARFTVRLPVDTSQWQNLYVALNHLASDAEIKDWPERSSGLQPSSWLNNAQGRRCGVNAPRAEGGEYMNVIGFHSGMEDVSPRRAPLRITDGAWHVITIQTFRDGRCAYAIDGTPMSISQTSMRRGLPLRVMIGGQSIGTTIEVGVVEAWSGLRTDIDWSLVQRPTGNR